MKIEADNGVRVNANVTTTVGDLVVNGDVDNSADGIDSIAFANGLVMTAGRDLLLSSATGNMTGAGALTLQAKRDTVLGSSLANSGALTLIADSDLDNSGTVRVAAGQTVAVTGTGLLRAQSADIDLQGALSNVAGEVRLQTHSGRTQALGTATGDWQLDNGEIGRITASLLTIGGAITGPEGGNILVSGVTSGSNGIQSWTLDAAGPANVGNTAQVQFDPADSSFRSLTVRAVDGIRVDANITTTEGGLSFNPNSNGAREGNDRLTIGAGKTLTSAGALTLTGETTGLGALGLNAAEGVTLDGATTVAGNVTIDADTDRNGSGTFSVTSGGLSTAGADVTVTSADINLGVTPSINAGAGTVSLQVSKDLLPMRVGGENAQPGGWNLLSAEVQRITAGTLIVGGTANGLLTVSALSSTNTTNLGEVILRSTGNGQGVQVDG
ncbi:MAG: hypothetical protein ACKOFW_15100, partial [Planctomycetaceae bacterium]